jgi:DNA (cytosine-5)-methyltransferase 1
MKMRRPVAVDIFCSAGGLSTGLEMAGFKVAVANELQETAAATYVANHPNTDMIRKDVRTLSASEIVDFIGGSPSLLAGGPPCQGFSSAGRRDINDPRNFLFKEFLRLTEQLSPKKFLMENVPGMISLSDGHFVKSVISGFEDIGYRTSLVVLNAADFGVPQTRNRIFIVGGSGRKINVDAISSKKSEMVSVEDAIGDLGFLKNGESSSRYMLPPTTDYQRRMRGGCSVLKNHVASKHSRKVTERFSMIRSSIIKSRLPWRLSTRKFSLVRLNPRRPSRTLTTLPDDHIHYKEDRILTVREMARLQSFPDSYVFLGPRTTGGRRRKLQAPQYTQVGNAVPPLLAKVVGEWIRTS